MINLATENKVWLRVVVGLKFIAFNSATAHTLTVSGYKNTEPLLIKNINYENKK